MQQKIGYCRLSYSSVVFAMLRSFLLAAILWPCIWTLHIRPFSNILVHLGFSFFLFNLLLACVFVLMHIRWADGFRNSFSFVAGSFARVLCFITSLEWTNFYSQAITVLWYLVCVMCLLFSQMFQWKLLLILNRVLLIFQILLEEQSVHRGSVLSYTSWWICRRCEDPRWANNWSYRQGK